MQLCVSIFQFLQEVWLSVFLGIKNMCLTELEVLNSDGHFWYFLMVLYKKK